MGTEWRLMWAQEHEAIYQNLHHISSHLMVKLPTMEVLNQASLEPYRMALAHFQTSQKLILLRVPDMLLTRSPRELGLNFRATPSERFPENLATEILVVWSHILDLAPKIIVLFPTLIIIIVMEALHLVDENLNHSRILEHQLKSKLLHGIFHVIVNTIQVPIKVIKLRLRGMPAAEIQWSRVIQLQTMSPHRTRIIKIIMLTLKSWDLVLELKETLQVIQQQRIVSIEYMCVQKRWLQLRPLSWSCHVDHHLPVVRHR